MKFLDVPVEKVLASKVYWSPIALFYTIDFLRCPGFLTPGFLVPQCQK